MATDRFVLDSYTLMTHGPVVEDLLDTLLVMLNDGDLAAWPSLEATTRYQFETLGVEFADEDEDEEDDDGAK